MFSIVPVLISIPTNNVGEFPFSTLFPAFVICGPFNDSSSDSHEVISHYGFDLHFSNK